MTATRQTVPGQFWQGVDEELSYSIDVGNWDTAPTGASTVVKLSGSDVSASILSGATAVSGSLITTPCLASLSAGEDYRVEIKFSANGLIYECFFTVTGET